jgi:hypothetical protein
MRIPVCRISSRTIGGQIIAAEQFLLILLGCQGAWQPLRFARNVLATDQMGQIGDLRVPGKLLQQVLLRSSNKSELRPCRIVCNVSQLRRDAEQVGDEECLPNLILI